MTTTLQKMSVAALGAAAVSLGGVAPAQAFELKYTFEGTTGDAYSYLYPEYQNARFSGYFTVDSDAIDENPDPYKGKFKLTGFFMEIVNDCFPEFKATVTPGTNPYSSSEYLLLGSLTLSLTDGDNDNYSLYNPDIANFQLFFNDSFFESNPNQVPTTAPDAGTFKPANSFLKMQVGSIPGSELNIPVSAARIEAVPEPTTMAGLTVFGLGVYLKRRADRKRNKK